jgi:endoglucanase
MTAALPIALASMALACGAAPAPAAAETDATAPDTAGASDAACAATAWPLWEAYAAHFINADGRVVDHTDKARTVSEGQGYGLFFALVANDRARFDALLAWTQENLAGGDLGKRLPAWHWGQRPDGTWGVVDPNAASDADLWIAYALYEADRLWGVDAYGALAERLLKRVVDEEVATLPGVGAFLLPAPVGFELGEGRYRLNPSYLPIQQLRYFAMVDPKGPWAGMVPRAVAMLEAGGPHGLQPDWIGYDKAHGWIVDPVSGPTGSYDAIRVYLWAALLDRSETQRATVLHATRGLIAAWREIRRVPERVDTRAPSLATANGGPVGFIATAMAYARATGDDASADALHAAVEAQRRGSLFADTPRYYDHNLLLFALGHDSGRYRFDASGRLVVPWKEGSCASVP